MEEINFKDLIDNLVEEQRIDSMKSSYLRINIPLPENISERKGIFYKTNELEKFIRIIK